MAEEAPEGRSAFRDEEDSDEEGGGAPAWMVTFGDMMSLLLTFFVMLLSLSTFDKIKFKEVTGSLSQAFGVQREQPTPEPPKGSSIVFQQTSASTKDSAIMARLQELKSAAQASRSAEQGKVNVEVFEDYRGIVLRVGEGDMFHPGRAELRPTVWPFLDDVIAAIENEKVDIEVEAHTDNRPMKSGKYPTNWHLSAARSVSVVDYMIKAGDLAPSRMAAVGRGDSRPLRPNISAKNRAKNRRVEFVFSRVAKKED